MKTKTAHRPVNRNAGRRNRKLHAEKMRMPARTAVIVVLLSTVGFFYLLFCTRTEALGQQIKSEEDALEALRRKVAGEEVRWNDMIGPRSLRAALQRHQLTMAWPRPDQVVHIRDLALWESNAGQMNVYGRLDAAPGRNTMP
jgi:hypothetical protein